MDINAFRTFVEVAKTLHFGNAAKNLCITQSAVSVRIRNLEESLSTELFVRERGNIQLTAEGVAMLNHAKTIVATWGRAQQEVGKPDGIRESIVIGGLSGLWDTTLQTWLNRLIQGREKFTITAEEHSAAYLIERVINGSMDIAFVYDAPNGEDLVHVALSEIPIRLVSSTAAVSVEHAMLDDYILVDWGTSFAVNHASVFPDLPVTGLRTSISKVAYNYILEYGGAAYLAESMVESAINDDKLFYVKDAPIFERTVSAVYRKNTDTEERIIRLLKFL